MTREETKEYVDENFVFLAISDTYSLIDKIYDDFEQQIQKTPRRKRAFKKYAQRLCNGANWFDVVAPIYKYHIKPKEPIYEWQWVYGLRGLDTRSAHISPHLTIPELKQYLNDRNSTYSDDYYFYHPIEETKRRRKQ